MSLNTLKSFQKSQSSKGLSKSSIRFLPYTLTPHEYRKKLPQPTFNCESCVQVSEQWSNLFHEICDSYEEKCNQLQSVSIQLSAARSKVCLKENVSEKAMQSHIHTQTPYTKVVKSTQTGSEISKSDVHTQTPNTKRSGNGAHCDESQEIQQVTCSSNISLFYRYTTLHDHPYADGTAIADHKGLAESQNLFECRVCSKIYSYDKMRKHYLQFINRPSTRTNRYAHGHVSKQTHQRYLDELKASKPQSKYF